MMEHGVPDQILHPGHPGSDVCCTQRFLMGWTHAAASGWCFNQHNRAQSLWKQRGCVSDLRKSSMRQTNWLHSMSKEHLAYGACVLISLWHLLCCWFVLPVVSYCSKVQNGKNSLWHLLNKAWIEHQFTLRLLFMCWHQANSCCSAHCAQTEPHQLSLGCCLKAQRAASSCKHDGSNRKRTKSGEKPTLSKGDNNFIKQSSRWWNSCQSQLLWAYFRHLSGNEDGIQSREHPHQDSLVFDNCLHHCLE